MTFHKVDVGAIVSNNRYNFSSVFLTKWPFEQPRISIVRNAGVIV